MVRLLAAQRALDELMEECALIPKKKQELAARAWTRSPTRERRVALNKLIEKCRRSLPVKRSNLAELVRRRLGVEPSPTRPRVHVPTEPPPYKYFFPPTRRTTNLGGNRRMKDNGLFRVKNKKEKRNSNKRLGRKAKRTFKRT